MIRAPGCRADGPVRAHPWAGGARPARAEDLGRAQRDGLPRCSAGASAPGTGGLGLLVLSGGIPGRQRVGRVRASGRRLTSWSDPGVVRAARWARRQLPENGQRGRRAVARRSGGRSAPTCRGCAPCRAVRERTRGPGGVPRGRGTGTAAALGPGVPRVLAVLREGEHTVAQSRNARVSDGGVDADGVDLPASRTRWCAEPQCARARCLAPRR